MTTRDEATLTARLAAGDPEAFEEAYRSLAPRYRAIAYRILGDDASAQDAVQEAFVALWRHRDGLVVRSAGVGPWLSVVTRNAALASVRATTRRVDREERVAAEGLSDVDIAKRGADAVDVRSALASLPEEQREVLTLAYFRGLTLNAVATRTGAPLGTVKRRAQLGLHRMARRLEGEES